MTTHLHLTKLAKYICFAMIAGSVVACTESGDNDNNTQTGSSNPPSSNNSNPNANENESPNSNENPASNPNTSPNTNTSSASVTSVKKNPPYKAGSEASLSILGSNLTEDIQVEIADCNNIKAVPSSDKKRLDITCTPSSEGYKNVKISEGTTDLLATLNASNEKGTFLTVFPELPQNTSKLNKTGVTTCANGEKDTLPCLKSLLNEEINTQQDGQVQSGLDDNYVTFGDDTCILDKNTNLVWELKTTDGGIRDRDWKYEWYNLDYTKNGGEYGEGDDGEGDCAISGCNSKNFIENLNARKYCGFDDWRLPTVPELTSIVNYGSQGQTKINTTVFTNTKPNKYMTINTWHGGYRSNQYYAAINFADGTFKSPNKDTYSSNYSHIRAVRNNK